MWDSHALPLSTNETLSENYSLLPTSLQSIASGRIILLIKEAYWIFTSFFLSFSHPFIQYFIIFISNFVSLLTSWFSPILNLSLLVIVTILLALRSKLNDEPFLSTFNVAFILNFDVAFHFYLSNLDFPLILINCQEPFCFR